MLNFMPIGQTDTEKWPFFSRFFKMAAVRHLDLLKFEFLTFSTSWRAKLRHHAKFRADRPSVGHFTLDISPSGHSAP